MPEEKVVMVLNTYEDRLVKKIRASVPNYCRPLVEDDLKVRDILLAFHFDADLFFGWFAPPFIKVHRAYTRLGKERIRDLLGRKLPGVTGQSLVRFYGKKTLPPYLSKAERVDLLLEAGARGLPHGNTEYTRYTTR